MRVGYHSKIEERGGRGRMEQLCYVTSEGLARGWTSELAAESIRLLWLILQEKWRHVHHYSQADK